MATIDWTYISGVDPGFQVTRGALKKKSRREEGGAKIFGVFRVKNHDFTQKKIIFFSNFRGDPPPLDPPLHLHIQAVTVTNKNFISIPPRCFFTFNTTTKDRTPSYYYNIDGSGDRHFTWRGYVFL